MLPPNSSKSSTQANDKENPEAKVKSKEKLAVGTETSTSGKIDTETKKNGES